MTYKKATSIELGKKYYYKAVDDGSYEEEEDPSLIDLANEDIYTKEGTESEKVREVLKTGWVKKKTYNESLLVLSIKGDEVLFNSCTYGSTIVDFKDLIDKYESTTYEEALKSL